MHQSKNSAVVLIRKHCEVCPQALWPRHFWQKRHDRFVQACQAVQCRSGRSVWTLSTVSCAYGSGERARPQGDSDLSNAKNYQNLRGVRSHSVSTILLMRASATGRKQSNVRFINISHI